MKVNSRAWEYHPITGEFVVFTSWYFAQYQHFYNKLMRVEL